MKRLLISVAAFVTLSACGAAGSSTGPGVSTDACNGEPPIPEFTLVSPASGATDVPVSTAALVFNGTPFTRVGQPSITLSTAAGITQTLSTFNPTSNGYSVPLSALSPGTTYTVTYVVPVLPAGSQSSPCSSTESIGEGAFTTQ
ncbi:MAG: hypothetical protein ABR949_13660 [Candidatus Aquilonibacter sp.]